MITAKHLSAFNALCLVIVIFDLIFINAGAERHYNALAEALVRGCEANQDQVAMSIENFCTTHPLTKGRYHDERTKDGAGKGAGE